LACAQTQYCSSSGICIALTIGTSQTSSGSIDLFVTLQAPSSAQWFSVGFGSSMSGALMLVAWPDNDSVVASVRLGRQSLSFLDLIRSGHSIPSPYSGSTLQILSGNVTSDLTSVQIQCSGCTTWSGGSLNTHSTSADFIYASGASGPSDPSNPSSSFPKHDDYGYFKLSLTGAQSTTTANAAPPVNTSEPNPTNSGVSLTNRQKVSGI
jgi:cellobiose dehydrogenase (acceptor)